MGTFLLTAASGFVLHRENAVAAHDVWHAWATAHTVAGLLFAFATVLHVRSHRCWFKGFARKACNRHRRTTTMLTLLFAILLVTGLILLPVTGADSSLGRLHFAAGLAAIPLCAVHMSGRSPPSGGNGAIQSPVVNEGRHAARNRQTDRQPHKENAAY